MSCKCQKCGQQYKVDIIVPDNIWEIIKPKGKKQGSGLLCGKCILEKLENLNKFKTFLLEEKVMHNNSEKCPLCNILKDSVTKNKA